MQRDSERDARRSWAVLVQHIARIYTNSYLSNLCFQSPKSLLALIFLLFPLHYVDYHRIPIRTKAGGSGKGVLSTEGRLASGGAWLTRSNVKKRGNALTQCNNTPTPSHAYHLNVLRNSGVQSNWSLSGRHGFRLSVRVQLHLLPQSVTCSRHKTNGVGFNELVCHF